MNPTLRGLLKSKTFWFNVTVGIIEIVDVLNGKVIPLEISGAVIAVGNIFLRFLTKKPLSEK